MPNLPTFTFSHQQEVVPPIPNYEQISDVLALVREHLPWTSNIPLDQAQINLNSAPSDTMSSSNTPSAAETRRQTILGQVNELYFQIVEVDELIEQLTLTFGYDEPAAITILSEARVAIERSIERHLEIVGRFSALLVPSEESLQEASQQYWQPEEVSNTPIQARHESPGDVADSSMETMEVDEVDVQDSEPSLPHPCNLRIVTQPLSLVEWPYLPRTSSPSRVTHPLSLPPSPSPSSSPTPPGSPDEENAGTPRFRPEVHRLSQMPIRFINERSPIGESSATYHESYVPHHRQTQNGLSEHLDKDRVLYRLSRPEFDAMFDSSRFLVSQLPFFEVEDDEWRLCCSVTALQKSIGHSLEQSFTVEQEEEQLRQVDSVAQDDSPQVSQAPLSSSAMLVEDAAPSLFDTLTGSAPVSFPVHAQPEPPRQNVYSLARRFTLSSPTDVESVLGSCDDSSCNHHLCRSRRMSMPLTPSRVVWDVAGWNQLPFFNSVEIPSGSRAANVRAHELATTLAELPFSNSRIPQPSSKASLRITDLLYDVGVLMSSVRTPSWVSSISNQTSMLPDAMSESVNAATSMSSSSPQFASLVSSDYDSDTSSKTSSPADTDSDELARTASENQRPEDAPAPVILPSERGSVDDHDEGIYSPTNERPLNTSQQQSQADAQISDQAISDTACIQAMDEDNESHNILPSPVRMPSPASSPSGSSSSSDSSSSGSSFSPTFPTPPPWTPSTARHGASSPHLHLELHLTFNNTVNVNTNINISPRTDRSAWSAQSTGQLSLPGSPCTPDTPAFFPLRNEGYPLPRSTQTIQHGFIFLSMGLFVLLVLCLIYQLFAMHACVMCHGPCQRRDNGDDPAEEVGRIFEVGFRGWY
ncbi:MAG: hypothetical protein M1828_000515 [Chrysothrix sp. TS-e1954]|nr:MAG: hypothetical protein M1828_000515 [Chrysothrix sp. TS-e1954]